MTRLKWLISILAGTFVYIALSAAYGPNGFFAYRQLQEQKNQISVHTAEIQRINDELFLEYTALQNDRDVIMAYARKLDYISPGEKLVKINGLPPVENKIYDTGTVVRHSQLVWIPEAVCKGAGFCVFLAVSFFFILIAFISGTNSATHARKIKKSKESREIPIYDVPQI